MCMLLIHQSQEAAASTPHLHWRLVSVPKAKEKSFPDFRQILVRDFIAGQPDGQCLKALLPGVPIPRLCTGPQSDNTKFSKQS